MIHIEISTTQQDGHEVNVRAIFRPRGTSTEQPAHVGMACIREALEQEHIPFASDEETMRGMSFNQLVERVYAEITYQRSDGFNNFYQVQLCYQERLMYCLFPIPLTIQRESLKPFILKTLLHDAILYLDGYKIWCAASGFNAGNSMYENQYIALGKRVDDLHELLGDDYLLFQVALYRVEKGQLYTTSGLFEQSQHNMEEININLSYDDGLLSVIKRMTKEGWFVLRLHVYTSANNHLNAFYDGLLKEDRDQAFQRYLTLMHDYQDARLSYECYKNENGLTSDEMQEEGTLLSYPL